MSKDTLQIGLYLFLSFLSVILIPILDKILFIQQSEEPGIITFVGVGLAVSFFIITALRVVMRTSLNIPGQFLFFFIIYNVLIIIVKFSLAPASLYLVNQSQEFGEGFESPLVSGSIGLLPIWFIRPFIIFLLYLLVFIFMYFIFKRKFKNEVGENYNQEIQDSNFNKYQKYKKFTLLGIKIYVLAILIFIISIFIVSIDAKDKMTQGIDALLFWFYFYFGFSFFSFLEYAGNIFLTLYSTLIALALVGAVYFATKAFQTAKEQAVVLRDISVLVSFFWIGAAFLFIYHALWAVYFLIIATLWPFAVVHPK
jgi:hypothetical protein